MATVLSETGTHVVEASDGLWVSAAEAERLTGWSLKPEGMCRDALCVPLPPKALRHDKVDLAAFWEKLGNPLVHDAAREVYSLAAGAGERNAALEGLEAPDFTLPDLSGKPHTLSRLRGSKVFLATWASW